MKLTCFVFTHAPEAPLLSRCIAAARAGRGNHDVSFTVVEDGNSPLPPGTRAGLTVEGVAVVRSVQSRQGNLRGLRWFAEQMQIMSDHAGDADLVLKIDPDTLVLSLVNVVKPLVDDPSLTGAGFGNDDRRYVYGPCYAFRRWIIDYVAAKYSRSTGLEQDEMQEAAAIANGSRLTRLVPEDVLLSREALSFGPLHFSQNRARWRHDKDGRDMTAVKAKVDVVLFGNPGPVAHTGGAQPVIARVMDSFLAADTAADPLPEGGKPVVVLGLGPGRSGTSFLATLLNMQPGAWISHESYSPVLLNLPNVDGFAQRLVKGRSGRRFIGDFTLCHTWMAAGMTRWLVGNGYPVKLVVTERDAGQLLASWLGQMERQQHDPFVTVPPEGWPHRGWSKALPKFNAFPDRENRVRAYFSWCRDHVAALEEEFPGMVRRIDTADMNKPAKINALLDWIGMPVVGRRLELLGTPVNPGPNP